MNERGTAGDAAGIAAVGAGVREVGHGEALALAVRLVEDGDVARVLRDVAVFDVRREAHERRLVVVEGLAVRVLEVGVLGDMERLAAAFLGEAAEVHLDNVGGHDRGGREGQEGGELHAVHRCDGFVSGICGAVNDTLMFEEADVEEHSQSLDNRTSEQETREA